MGLTVNGELVEDALIQQEFEAIKGYESSRLNLSCCEKDGEFREKAVENVVSRVALLQEVERSTSAPSAAEIDMAVKRLKESHGGEEKFYAAFGLTPEQEPEVRQNVEVNLRVERLLEAAAGPETEPTPEEIEAHYRARIDRYRTAEQVRVSHIVRSPGPGGRAAAYEELRKVRDRLLEGADVEALWREHSDTAKGNESPGADMGWFALGEVMPELEAVAFSLREGEVSPVFGSMVGLHLVKLTERRPALPKPLDEIRTRVKEDFVQERRQSRMKSFMEDLRARAVVERTPSESA
jgi:parvulin-like peptidyl-prolyl isomerase